jgi:carbamoyl-phosphate synthase large subunit
MKRILVSGASGIVGYGILRSLRQTNSDLFLVGTSIHENSVAPAFCDLFEKALPTDHPDYLDWLLDVLRRNAIDMLIPGIEIDLYFWFDHIGAIRSVGAIPLLNDIDLIRLCKDKWHFSEALKAAGQPCNIPSALDADFTCLSERFGLPFILKPRRGFGSKGFVRIADAATFAKYQGDMGSVLLAQPLVGNDDEEFTTSVFANGQGGYFAAMTLRRKLSKDGFTDRAEVVETTAFNETLAALCQQFRPLGPTNFQFRLSKNGPLLLEINPRISSSTSIRCAFGYNESAMAVAYFLEGQPPSQPKIRGGRAIRYTEDKVFYDDCIYF